MAISLIPWQLLPQVQLPQQWQQLVLLLLPVLLSLPLIVRSKKGLKLPPGPAGLPVLGNLHQLGSLPHRSLLKLARRHGPVMMLRLGATDMLVVSSAWAAREVLKVHDADCCSRPACPGPKRLSYGFKDMAFASYGENWREMRKIFIVELLSMCRVKAAWGARQEQVDKLMAALTPNEPVALGEHIFAFTDGIIGTVALGNIYGAGNLALKKHFEHVLDEAMDMLATFSAEDFFPNAAGRLVDRLTGLVARRDRLFRNLDDFFETVIEQHLDPARPKPEKDGDLVDVLIDLWKEEHRGFTKDHIKAIIMDTFVGGIDTSSVTILWAMSELIRHPRVMKKVQEEIRTAVGAPSQRVEPDDLPKLNYLKMILKETLRLYPPATLLLPRETMRDVKIGGYDVPARTRVTVNAWALGRDPMSWGEDAEEFNPDRFEAGARHSEVDLHGLHFELVPFGAGRRICPGLAMALMNVEFALANLLCGFDWELPKGTKAEDLCMEEAGGLTFHRKTRLVLVPTPYMPPSTA